MKSKAQSLRDSVVEGMLDKKANNIVIIDLKDVPGAVADTFIVCHGDSDRQVQAIATGVEKETALQVQESPVHKEGQQLGHWVILDYFNVVVHIFHKDFRELYNLEKYWGDATIQEVKQAV